MAEGQVKWEKQQLPPNMDNRLFPTEFMKRANSIGNVGILRYGKDGFQEEIETKDRTKEPEGAQTLHNFKTGDDPVIEATCRETSFHLLMDTGSQCNLMPINIWENITPIEARSLTPSNHILTGVTNTKLSHQGIGKVPVTIGSNTLTIPFFITNQPGDQAILGHPEMSNKGININPGKGITIMNPPIKIHHIKTKEHHPDEGISLQLQAATTTKIPPFQSRLASGLGPTKACLEQETVGL